MTTHVRITGAPVILDKMVSSDGKIDFNSVIPVPDECIYPEDYWGCPKPNFSIRWKPETLAVIVDFGVPWPVLSKLTLTHYTSLEVVVSRDDFPDEHFTVINGKVYRELYDFTDLFNQAPQPSSGTGTGRPKFLGALPEIRQRDRFSINKGKSIHNVKDVDLSMIARVVRQKHCGLVNVIPAGETLGCIYIGAWNQEGFAWLERLENKLKETECKSITLTWINDATVSLELSVSLNKAFKIIDLVE